VKALVTYDSKLGNTEQVAQTVADTLGEEGIGQLISVDEADALELEGVDLLVLGGPTQRHGLSRPSGPGLSSSLAGSCAGCS